MKGFEMVRRGLDSMEQVVQTLELDGSMFGGLYISQEEMENGKLFADICGDCLVDMDFLDDLFGSSIGN